MNPLKNNELKTPEDTGETLKLAFEASPSAILVVNEAGEIVLANKKTFELFKYEKEKLYGLKVEDLVPQRYRPNHLGYRKDYQKSPTTRSMGAGRDLFGLKSDGSEIPIEIGLNPITTPQGKFIVATILDITERKKAEERFRLVVEAAPNAMVMVDKAGKITLINKQAELLFEYSREELLNMQIENLVPERFRQKHPDHRKGFFAEPKPRAMGAGRDLFGLTKTGREIPIEIGLNPLTTGEGTFVLASIVDVTERKKSERFAIQSAIIESSTDAIVGKNLDGIITSWNKGAELLYEYSAAETIGKHIYLIVPDEVKHEINTYLEKIKTGVKVEQHETKRRKKSGEVINVSLTISPIKDMCGKVIGASAIARDITERKKAEEEVKQKTERLQRFQNLTVGRELEMMKLKREVNELSQKLGEPVKYPEVGSS